MDISQNTLPRELLIARIHRWGSSVAESLLDPSCHIFTHPEIDGLIGYRINKGCAIVFGDPVCSVSDRSALADAFHRYCARTKKNVIYLVASNEFATWMHEKQGSGLIAFGEELYLDPICDPRTRAGKKGITLRGKIRHAEKKGVLVKEYLGDTLEIEQKIQDVAKQWLLNRHGPQIYISKVRFFDERLGRRWFYAMQEERIVGSFVINQLKVKQGWVLDRIMTVPDAPQGTSEILVVSMLERLAQEGCRFLTFGASNGACLGAIKGFNKGTSFLAQNLYKLAQKYFKIDGTRRFWEKFHPERSPTYLVFKTPRLGFHEITGLMEALNVSYRPLHNC